MIEGLVLVGGASRRLGRDKAFLDIDGVPAVARIVDALRPLVSRVRLIGGDDRFAGIDAGWIPDAEAGAGPLGGIISGLAVIEASYALVLACDTPLVSTPLLECLLAARTAGCEAVVPRHGGGIEPLVALYAREARRPLALAYERGERAMHRVLQTLRVEYVDEAALRAVDPALDGFLNINTEADVERLQARLARLTPRWGNDRL